MIGARCPSPHPVYIHEPNSDWEVEMVFPADGCIILSTFVRHHGRRVMSRFRTGSTLNFLPDRPDLNKNPP